MPIWDGNGRIWNSTTDSAAFVCGFCGQQVASQKGWASQIDDRIMICPHCTMPTLFDRHGMQIPGIAPGSDVRSLPNEVAEAYKEARDAKAAGANTASVLMSRKLLMSVAVAQGAKEGLKFVQYVEYLADKGYVPPNGKGWVDHIRNKGNEATHEVKIMTPDDAEELITFLEMLLRFIYEFPNRIPGSAAP